MSWVRVASNVLSFTACGTALLAGPAWLAAAGCGNSGGGFNGGGGSLFDVGTGGSGTGTGGTGSGTGVVIGIGTGGGGTGTGTGTGITGSGTGTACTTNTGAITGTVTNTGGSISQLVFSVVGDTRGSTENDPSGYPTIITPIFQTMNALPQRPAFGLGTGDYQFSTASMSYLTTAKEQVQLFWTARGNFSGAFFPAMGNHECGVSGSYTTSDNNDCGPGNPGGDTANYEAFMQVMMSAIGQTLPYYTINVNAIDNSWTAKFVITAANAWSSAQQTWLTNTMAQKTTYTFVVRHEASDATPPIPDCIPTIDSIITAAGYTLLIVGHTHDYGHYSDSQQTVTFGNGGAPESTGENYPFGFGLFTQRCDGAIIVNSLDSTGAIQTDHGFPFAVTPTGQPTN